MFVLLGVDRLNMLLHFVLPQNVGFNLIEIKKIKVFFFLFVCTTFLYEYMKSVKKRLKIPKG